MKKILLGIMAWGLTSLAYADFTFSNGPKLYVGGSAGVSNQGDSCNDPFFKGECDSKSTTWKVFGGARVNPMAGVEASYHHLGDVSKGGTTGGEAANMKNELTGISVAGVGYVPLANRVEAFGKAGAMFWNRDTKQGIGGIESSSTDHGTSPLLGVGAQFQLNNNVHLRGEWEHTFNVGADSSYETDVDQYTLGAMYSTL